MPVECSLVYILNLKCSVQSSHTLNVGKKEVCGAHFPREPNQGVRMGHVAAMTTEALETANLPHTNEPPVSLGSWGNFE